MNKQNFLQTGGFPLETDTLAAMQTAYEIFNALGEIAGNKAIIKGCVVTGSTVSDGVVYVNGEVFKFVGGNIQTTVRILQNITSKAFENGDENEVHYERYITFASGVDSIPWADFIRLESILSLQGRLLPPGTNPQLYSGSIEDIPAGWQLCDGSNGTPDLKGKFIVGYNPADGDYDEIGNTGGEKEHTLSVNEMPQHNHGGNTSTNGSHTHTGLTFAASEADNGETSGTLIPTTYHQPIGNKTQSGAVTGSGGSHNHTISNQGNGAAHENRPPYYTLAYIIYLG